MNARFNELFGYNTWANLRIFDAAAKLTDEQISRPIVSSFPSILETLKHILSAEWVWLQRWKGSSPTAMPAVWASYTLVELRRAWQENDRELRAWVAGLTEADLKRVVEYRSIAGKPFSNTMEEMLTHVVNHSTYHRGQITTMLRQVGAETTSTDVIVYYREHQQTR